MTEQAGVVTGVHIFPIKSCREATVEGEFPAELKVGQTGFQVGQVVDRGLVVADENRLFASQRGWDNVETEHRGFPGDARLATVAVDIRRDHLSLTAEGFGTLELGLDRLDGPSERLTIFGNPFFGRTMGAESARFFSGVVSREVQLYQFDPQFPRAIHNR